MVSPEDSMMKEGQSEQEADPRVQANMVQMVNHTTRSSRNTSSRLRLFSIHRRSRQSHSRIRRQSRGGHTRCLAIRAGIRSWTSHLGTNVRALRTTDAFLRHIRHAYILQCRRCWIAKYPDIDYSSILCWCFRIFATHECWRCYCRYV